jgi:hypothetical protein
VDFDRQILQEEGTILSSWRSDSEGKSMATDATDGKLRQVRRIGLEVGYTEVFHPLMESKYSFLVWCKILVFPQHRGHDPYWEKEPGAHITYYDSSVINNLRLAINIKVGLHFIHIYASEQVFKTSPICSHKVHKLFLTV